MGPKTAWSMMAGAVVGELADSDTQVVVQGPLSVGSACHALLQAANSSRQTSGVSLGLAKCHVS
jgi:hypothetical protein